MARESLISGTVVGRIRTIVGTDPAAGVEISETVPTGVAWRLCCMGFSLVTAAVGGSRVVRFNIDDGAGNASYSMGSNYEQVAARTDAYSVASLSVLGLTVPIGVFASEIAAIPFPFVFLPAASRVFTLTSGLEAADDYGAPVFIVEEIPL